MHNWVTERETGMALFIYRLSKNCFQLTLKLQSYTICTSAVCTLFLNSLQTTYGSEHERLRGIGQGRQHKVKLVSNEYITEAHIGFGLIRFKLAPSPSLCYLVFKTNLYRTFGPYDGNCETTTITRYNLSSGLAYFSGRGDWCIEELTLNYFE